MLHTAGLPLRHRKERRCLSCEGGGNTGRRRCLGHEGSGDTRQRRCLSGGRGRQMCLSREGGGLATKAQETQGRGAVLPGPSSSPARPPPLSSPPRPAPPPTAGHAHPGPPRPPSRTLPPVWSCRSPRLAWPRTATANPGGLSALLLKMVAPPGPRKTRNAPAATASCSRLSARTRPPPRLHRSASSKIGSAAADVWQPAAAAAAAVAGVAAAAAAAINGGHSDSGGQKHGGTEAPSPAAWAPENRGCVTATVERARNC